MVSRGRRSGGRFHGEVTQGRGGEELSTLHSSRGRQECRQKVARGRGGGTDAADDERSDEMNSRLCGNALVWA